MGARSSFNVDPAEAERAATEALISLDRYNAKTGTSALALAAPTAESCQWCDYRGCYPAFYEAVSPQWEFFGRRFALGTVIPDPAGAPGVVSVTVSARLPAETVTVARLLLPAGSEVAFNDGTTVAIASGWRAAADGDITVD